MLPEAVCGSRGRRQAKYNDTVDRTYARQHKGERLKRYSKKSDRRRPSKAQLAGMPYGVVTEDVEFARRPFTVTYTVTQTTTTQGQVGTGEPYTVFRCRSDVVRSARGRQLSLVPASMIARRTTAFTRRPAANPECGLGHSGHARITVIPDSPSYIERSNRVASSDNPCRHVTRELYTDTNPTKSTYRLLQALHGATMNAPFYLKSPSSDHLRTLSFRLAKWHPKNGNVHSTVKPRPRSGTHNQHAPCHELLEHC